jgi:GNAT acetyltransferase-like protein
MRDVPPIVTVPVVTGYMHPKYAQSHHEFGVPRELPRCQGWIIERRIPGFAASDAMGCYPLFACRNWSQLLVDIENLGDQLVSLALVTDPFGDYDESYLRRCFPDLAVPFKEHYVVDLEKPQTEGVSRRHRKEARRALRHVSVQVHPDPPGFLDTWMRLHSHLIAKHNVKGIAAFSRSAFADQLATPGTVALSASYLGEPVAATLYIVHDDVAYGHILGCTDIGYEQSALYALISFAIDHFSGSLRWLDMMGVPGGQDAGSEGIRRFKQGWTHETRTAWLCGRILNRARYAEIVDATGTRTARYFPAYRDGEMVQGPRETSLGAGLLTPRQEAGS